MVFENKLADLLQTSASYFLHGFSADQLRIGVLRGCLEFCNLTLNPEPLDTLLVESEVPFSLKLGTVNNASLQISLLQGGLDLAIDGVTLVLGPCCRHLSRAEVLAHKASETQRLEFVQGKSQSQRSSMEQEMLRQLFKDYLSRLKLTVKSFHVRLEVEREFCDDRGQNVVFGLFLQSCKIAPPSNANGNGGTKGAVAAVIASPNDRGNDQVVDESGLFLSERIDVENLMFYHEASDVAQVVVGRKLQVTENFNDASSMLVSRLRFHLTRRPSQQFMPGLSFSVGVDMLARPDPKNISFDACLEMEIAVHVQTPFRLNLSARNIEHAQWFLQRFWDFQLWFFMQPSDTEKYDKSSRAAAHWASVRHFIATRRKIHGNRYTLSEAVAMRSDCKEYVKLFKKTFGGPHSSVPWRRGLEPVKHEESLRLEELELMYPADKTVNFRLMANAEMRTEDALNGTSPTRGRATTSGGPPNQKHSVWSVAVSEHLVGRELTPLEKLHLHGQQGYGAGIYRGCPPPQSSMKISVNLNIPEGFFWTCELNVSPYQARNGSTYHAERECSQPGIHSRCWALALDCMRRPLRVRVGDSKVDTSIFVTLEFPIPTEPVQFRPLALLLARSTDAFIGSEGLQVAGHVGGMSFGGHDASEWCSIMQLDGPLRCCCQIKNILSSFPGSPWDVFCDFSCVGEDCEERMDRSVGEALRIRVPFCLPSGQEVPLAPFLRWCHQRRRKPFVDSRDSAIGWFAHHLYTTRNLCTFRVHARFPEVTIQSSLVGHSSENMLRLPCTTFATHFEDGGFVDGFVVGLHNLRAFVENVVFYGHEFTPTPEGMGKTMPLPMQSLESAPPLLSLIAPCLASFAVAASVSHKLGPQCDIIEEASAALRTEVQNCGIKGCLSGNLETESDLASLLLVTLGVVTTRRLDWEESSNSAKKASTSRCPGAVDRVYLQFGLALQTLSLMGLPLHQQCAKLGAWAGATSIVASTLKYAGEQVQNGLVAWAARGSYAAPRRGRHVETVRWLVEHGASMADSDELGRSVVDWCAWGGDPDLLSLALRNGTSAIQDQLTTSGKRHQIPAPLLLAVASRNQDTVRMLLKIAADPHASPLGSGMSSLMLAIRYCEFGIAAEILRSSAGLVVEAALCPAVSAQSPTGMPNVSRSARATAALLDSLRRFSNVLSRGPPEDVEGSAWALVSARHNPLPGPHMDESLYATSQLPFIDLMHPLASKLPVPVHRVIYKLRPAVTPLKWVLDAEGSGIVDPWQPARLFLQCCLHRGFQPDTGVLARAASSLPADASEVAQTLLVAPSRISFAFDRRVNGAKRLVTPLENDLNKRGHVSPLPTLIAASYAEADNFFTGNAEIGCPIQCLTNEVECVMVSDCNSDVGAGVPEFLRNGGWAPNCWSNSQAARCTRRQGGSKELPNIRVVVTGAPLVGKSAVSRILLTALEVAEDEPVETFKAGDFSATVRICPGTWPPGKTGKNAAQANVCIWDGPPARFPGLLHILSLQISIPTLIVQVVDALSTGEQASLISSIGAGIVDRTLVVNNVFKDTRSIDLEGSKPTPTAHSHRSIQCDVNTAEGEGLLKKAFTNAMLELLRDVDLSQLAARGRSRTPIASPLSLTTNQIVGKALFSNPPRLVSAWAALQSARSFLTKGNENGRCGDALIPVSRIETVFTSVLLETCANNLETASQDLASSTQKGLLRSLEDVALVCPLPAGTPGISQQVLVPDFANRIRLTATAAAKFAPAVQDSPESSDLEIANTLSVRICWPTDEGVFPPSLRSAFRDFLSRGYLGPCGGKALRRMRIRRFALLESGPSASTGSLTSRDALSLGFFMTFDFVPCDEAENQAVETEDPLRSPLMCTSACRVGCEQDDEEITTTGSLTSSVASRATVLIVGIGESEEGPYWDVFCAGPHSRWAWRAFLGNGGNCGLSFASACLHTTENVSTPRRWPLRPPRYILSTSTGPLERGCHTTAQDIPEIWWLLTGRRADLARSALVGSCAQGRKAPRCCAVFWRPRLAPAVSYHDCGSLASSSIEACLFWKTWDAAPSQLAEVFASGPEAWAVCMSTLARFARDRVLPFTPSGAGFVLPLLRSPTTGNRGSVEVSLIAEGPTVAESISLCVRSRPGLDAWLNLCKPAALWSDATQRAADGAPYVALHDLAKALQLASAVQLTETMVAEIWDVGLEVMAAGA